MKSSSQCLHSGSGVKIAVFHNDGCTPLQKSSQCVQERNGSILPWLRIDWRTAHSAPFSLLCNATRIHVICAKAGCAIWMTQFDSTQLNWVHHGGELHRLPVHCNYTMAYAWYQSAGFCSSCGRTRSSHMNTDGVVESKNWMFMF